MAFSAHLVFDGQCERAFHFYSECFGAKIISMLKWAETPAADQAPAGSADRIIHATRFGVVTDRSGNPWEINCSKQH